MLLPEDRHSLPQVRSHGGLIHPLTSHRCLRDGAEKLNYSSITATATSLRSERPVRVSEPCKFQDGRANLLKNPYSSAVRCSLFSCFWHDLKDCSGTFQRYARMPKRNLSCKASLYQKVSPFLENEWMSWWPWTRWRSFTRVHTHTWPQIDRRA